MSVEQNLLFAVLAFEDELIDLQQLTAACRAWAGDKSKPLANLLVERGWVTAEHRRFLEEKAERKLSKHQNDPRVTLNAVTRGDVCDALLKEVDDSVVRQSLSSWPSAGPVLIETIGETMTESEQPNSRYTWVSEVGRGALGKVWMAKDNDLAREVALKEIKPGSVSSEAIRKLIKEAQITSQLQHPSIVPVYEVKREGRPFYTMKLVRGETLSQVIGRHHEQRQQDGKSDPLSMQRLMNAFLNVCDAMAYAHSRGVIHRDLKPQNIVLGEYGEAIVLDWGLAKQVDGADKDSAAILVTDDAMTDATRGGATPGTPAYMSPEQASGQIDLMDPRTDIYGLGAILFEILTGEPPHSCDRTTPDARSGTKASSRRSAEATQTGPFSPIPALLHRIATGDTPHPRDILKSVSLELNSICVKAMSRHREDRYQTAAELKAGYLDTLIHAESTESASIAASDLSRARQTRNYNDFNRAIFGFEEALRKWSDNPRWIRAYQKTQTAYAQAAMVQGDYELALNVLELIPSHLQDASDFVVRWMGPVPIVELPPSSEHQFLAEEIRSAMSEQSRQAEQLAEQQQASTKLRRSLNITMLVILVVVASLGTYSELQRREAVAKLTIAIDNEAKAEIRRQDAESER